MELTLTKHLQAKCHEKTFKLKLTQQSLSTFNLLFSVFSFLYKSSAGIKFSFCFAMGFFMSQDMLSFYHAEEKPCAYRRKCNQCPCNILSGMIFSSQRL